MRTSSHVEDVLHICKAVVTKSRRVVNPPRHVAMLDGVALRRFQVLLRDGVVYHAGSEKVVQVGDSSLVCVVNGEKVYPVAVNSGRKLETCLRLRGGHMRWNEKTQARIARKCEAVLADIQKVGNGTEA